MSIKNNRGRKMFRTGAGEIDNKLGGGVPEGSLTLVEGESDSGKSVLVQHFAYGALTEWSKVAYYTTENTINSIVRQMESLNLSILDHYLLSNLKIIPVDSSQASERAEELGNAVLDHVSRLPKDYALVIIDSITNIVTHMGASQANGLQSGPRSPEVAVMDFFSECKSLCDQGRTIFLAAHTHAFDQQLLIRVRSICDAHFSLKLRPVGERLVKILEVAKVHGAERSTGNIITFDVEPGLGIRMIPMSMAKA